MATYPREREALNNVPGFKLVMMGTFSDEHKCSVGRESEDSLGITIPWGTVIECEHCGRRWEWKRTAVVRQFSWRKLRWIETGGDARWCPYGEITWNFW